VRLRHTAWEQQTKRDSGRTFCPSRNKELGEVRRFGESEMRNDRVKGVTGSVGKRSRPVP
jgi:hypothetical protein